MNKSIKILAYALLSAFLLCGVMTSCGEKPKEPPVVPPTTDSTGVKVAQLFSFGDVTGKGLGIYEFVAILTDGDVVMDMETGLPESGNGNVIILDFFSDVMADDLSFLPDTYPVEQMNTADPLLPSLNAGFVNNNNYYGSYVTTVFDGSEDEFLMVVDGNVVVEREGDIFRLKATLELDNGDTKEFEYEGKLEFTDRGPYFTENHEAVSRSLTMTSAKIERSAVEGGDVLAIKLNNSDGYQFSTMILGKKGTSFVGNWEVASMTGLMMGKAMMSAGAEVADGGLNPVPTYLMQLDGNKINEIFYIVEGDFDITENGLSFTGKSRWGSEIKISYTGEMTETEGSLDPNGKSLIIEQ